MLGTTGALSVCLLWFKHNMGWRRRDEGVRIIIGMGMGMGMGMKE